MGARVVVALRCGSEAQSDSVRDRIETLERLGWEALTDGRLRDAIRIAAEPFLERAGTEGRNAQTPAALAYERLEMPDSAAAIYDRLVLATPGVERTIAPAWVIRSFALRRLAAFAGVPDSWLNDAVKSYLSPRGEYDPYLELEHLRVFVAQPPYILAMKCVALRLGEEFHDLDDVRYLLRYLNVSTLEEALAIVLRYFDEEHIPPKTRLALEELLGG